MLCAGSSTEICGGSSRISVYVLSSYNSSSVTTSTSPTAATSSAATVSSAVSLPTVGAYSYVGCQSDLVAKRTLSSKNTQSSTLTLEGCSTFCAGYVYFGVEYSAECYCGNTLMNTSTLTTDGRCNMKCNGNAAEIVVAPAVSLYTSSCLQYQPQSQHLRLPQARQVRQTT